ncbi:MAG: DUF1512 domain-containing protein [archaeon]|nr:DUF1512 domain-containing protein [archaeon]
MIFQPVESDPLTILLNLLFFAMIFISMFYGTKIQSWKSQKAIESALQDLKKYDNETRMLTVAKFKKYCDENLTVKNLENRIKDFMNFITINPTNLDPAGIVPKIDHIMNVRENRYLDEVKSIAVKADEIQVLNLENLIEAASAIHQSHRLLLHYLLLGKKTKSHMLLMQVEMQLGLIMGMAKAYVSASKAFSEGSPIGDGLGPMVAANFIRIISQSESVSYEDIAYQTIVQKGKFEEREIYIIRAKGPGGTVGKPGEAIKKLIEQQGNKIKHIIMVDAGLKMEGDKSGSVVMGVGAAIGGIGVEKYKIESLSTHNEIPVEAIICRQSLEDAICTMKKPITNSVPIIIDKIKSSIRRYTEKGDSLIIAGVGNTIGIGI